MGHFTLRHQRASDSRSSAPVGTCADLLGPSASPNAKVRPVAKRMARRRGEAAGHAIDCQFASAASLDVFRWTSSASRDASAEVSDSSGTSDAFPSAQPRVSRALGHPHAAAATTTCAAAATTTRATAAMTRAAATTTGAVAVQRRRVAAIPVQRETTRAPHGAPRAAVGRLRPWCGPAPREQRCGLRRAAAANTAAPRRWRARGW